MSKILSKFSNGLEFSMVGKRDEDKKAMSKKNFGKCLRQKTDHPESVYYLATEMYDCDELAIGEYSTAKLEFSFPFFDTFKILKLSGFYDISNLLVLKSDKLPINLVELELRSNRLSSNIYKNNENGLETISITKFLASFNNLEILNFDFNLFETLPFDKNTNPVLKTASFRNNKLERLEAHMLPKSLERLDVFGNQFECGCDDAQYGKTVKKRIVKEK